MGQADREMAAEQSYSRAAATAERTSFVVDSAEASGSRKLVGLAARPAKSASKRTDLVAGHSDSTGIDQAFLEEERSWVVAHFSSNPAAPSGIPRAHLDRTDVPP